MIGRIRRLAPFFAAVFALLLGGAGIAAAQAQHGSKHPSQAQKRQQPSFSDSDVKSFAHAVKDVQKIRRKYQPQMKNAKNKKEAQHIQMKAEQEMLAAIKGEGITVKKYAAISKALPNDPGLVKRIRAELEQ